MNIKQIKQLNFVAFLFHCGSWPYFIVAVDPISLWQLTQFRCGSWPIFVVAVGEIVSFTYNYRIKYDYDHKKMMQNYKKTTRTKGIFREIRCTFREIKSNIQYDRYYKAVTFLSFTLNSIKFYLITFAISDIFPNFASTFLTDEMNMKIQL